MKTYTTLLVFLFAITLINAQEITSINNDDITVEVSEDNVDITQESSTAVSLDNEEVSNACYREISKTAFYKALLEENGFDIELKEAQKEAPSYALRNTEDIIKRHKNRISYSE